MPPCQQLSRRTTNEAQTPGGSSAIVDSLTQAHAGLTGPVKVQRNGEEIKVTYTNKSDKADRCTGFVLNYDELVNSEIPKLAESGTSSPASVIGPVLAEKNNGAVLAFDKEGKPVSWSGEDAPKKTADGTRGATAPDRVTAAIEPGQSVEWTVTKPASDAVGLLLCNGGKNIHRGIEDSILFDQIGDKLGPAGSLVDGSSAEGSAGGAFVSSISFLAKIIEFFNNLFENLKKIFTGGGSSNGSSNGAEDAPAAGGDNGDNGDNGNGDADA
ncbi:MAG TPA: hypothetical protein H9867_05955 [Candidatus Corynebacterium gallistercoris]|uniref:Uncharacterized protein n=1 Tax=Candidatus Corynebacterium gallistercoris TaxID=2838530 RepID=A0A9D1UQ66_9CORY|nr:hypothetical protein [Candidatus Corynebacterium gallistercoris]